jgi:hypothetical protein
MAGQEEVRFELLALDDALVEGNEALRLSLAYTLGVQHGPQRSVLLILMDNDVPAATPRVRLSQPADHVSPRAQLQLAAEFDGPGPTLVRADYRVDGAFYRRPRDLFFLPGQLAAGRHRVTVEVADEWQRTYAPLALEFTVRPELALTGPLRPAAGGGLEAPFATYPAWDRLRLEATTNLVAWSSADGLVTGAGDQRRLRVDPADAGLRGLRAVADAP